MPLYTRDWLDDPALRQCSPAAQGVLLAVMCLMHESIPYGYLQDGDGVTFSEKFVLSRTMFSAKIYRSAIAELEARGRLHRTPDGILYCQRMVRDEDIRSRRAAGGTLGGNPTLKVNLSVDVKDNLNGYHSPSHVRSRAEIDTDTFLDLNSNNRNQNPVRASEGQIQFPDFAPWWKRWCELTGRRLRESMACQAWLSVVTSDLAPAAAACLERYGASDEVQRGIVSNPDRWLYDQARDKFAGEWQSRNVPPTRSEEPQVTSVAEFDRQRREHDAKTRESLRAKGLFPVGETNAGA